MVVFREGRRKGQTGFDPFLLINGVKGGWAFEDWAKRSKLGWGVIVDQVCFVLGL